jgi:hypothetical protein
MLVPRTREGASEWEGPPPAKAQLAMLDLSRQSPPTLSIGPRSLDATCATLFARVVSERQDSQYLGVVMWGSDGRVRVDEEPQQRLSNDPKPEGLPPEGVGPLGQSVSSATGEARAAASAASDPSPLPELPDEGLPGEGQGPPLG